MEFKNTGITGKLLLWFSLFVIVFFGTIFVLYLNIQQIVGLSGGIINNNYDIAIISKNMIENLLAMEEAEKKFQLLKKEDYIKNFNTAKNEFENHLEAVRQMVSSGQVPSTQWDRLFAEYFDLAAATQPAAKTEKADIQWISEININRWIDHISMLQTENDSAIEQRTRTLNRLGQQSANIAMMGLGITVVVGLTGILFLSYSMLRPLKELMRGIRSIATDRFSKPLEIHSQDEFGELATAFNDMAVQLKEEERMRSDFISMLSHEIRTPLTSIRESVNMIVEEVMGPINNRQRKFMEIASSEIGRICDLLNNLMQVSRLESMALKVKVRPIETDSFVIESVKHLKHIADARGIELKTDVPVGTPKIMADPEYLQHVLFNLLDNALKFSEDSGSITVRVGPGGQDHLVISVSDRGPGISEEEKPFIFNKYYQTRSARDHMDGVGLGLNISKQIIEKHGGAIWVESRVGDGSTFHFTVPLHKDKGKIHKKVRGRGE